MVQVQSHTKRSRRKWPLGITRQQINKQWDFDEYKLHPLWGTEEPELRVRPGDILFRGTTSAYVQGEKVKSHTWKTEPIKGPRRIYMSEGAEDAAGYGEIAVETSGGVPVLCEITLTKELFHALKPGYEGRGEWYIEDKALPKNAVRCIRLKINEYGMVHVPWENLTR